MKRSAPCFVDHAPGGCQLYDLVFIAVLVYSAMCPANRIFFVGRFYLRAFLVKNRSARLNLFDGLLKT